MNLSTITALAMILAAPSPSAVFAQGASATQTKPSDQELSNQIARAISNDATLSADAIKVSVEGGVVTLTGMVGKDADKARAERLARVPGVSRVQNNLKSREKATDQVKGTAKTVAGTTKKGAEKTADALSKTGEVITDEWIATRVRTNFSNDTALTGSAIEVESKNNVVTLTGTVPTAAARAKALAVAKEVEGVKRVVDKLKVTGKARV